MIGAVLAAADGAVHAVGVVVLAADVRQPFQARRVLHHVAVGADRLVDQALAEVGGEALVHERLGVAVDADDVVPPLVAGLVRDEVIDEAAGDLRQAENALVDHDQHAALVAVPAEKRLGHGEVVVRVRPEPLAVHGQGVAGDAERLLGVVFVLRQGQDVDADRVGDADARLQDGGELVVLGAAQKGEVAHAVGADVQPAAAVVERRVARRPTRCRRRAGRPGPWR